jgi:hypothetical protein
MSNRMAQIVPDEEATVDVEMAGSMMLQDILVMPEPKRTHYLKAWVDYGQYADDGGMVKLRTPDRKRLEVTFGGRGKKMVFPYVGKEVSRLQALQLLRDFGENGFYRGLDMATGMSEEAWETIQVREPDLAKQLGKRKLEFINNYLEQVPYGEESEEDELQED